MLAFLFGTLWLCPTGNASAATVEKRKVLVLYSYNDKLPWQQKVRKGFHSRLANKGLGVSTMLFEERLDSIRLGREINEQAWADYLTKKYAGISLDMVISQDIAAARFLTRHPELFRTTPRYLVESGSIRPGVRNEKLIRMKFDYEKYMRVVLDLSPQARRLVVVGNLIPVHIEALRSVWQKHYQDRLSFEAWTDDFSFEELYQRAAQLPKDAIILYWLVDHDRSGARAVPYDILQKLAARAAVPVFASHDTLLGSGTVGGYLMSGEHVGWAMADLIAGARPESFTDEFFFANLFDSRALQRWRIPDASLPVDSEIRFRPPSFWQQYKLFIVYGAPLVLIETLILIALVRALRTRRLAMTALNEQRQLLEQKVEDRTAELAQNEALYRSLFESSSDAIMLLDEKGFFDCNAATLALFDCPDVASFSRLHPSDLSPPTQPGGRSSLEAAQEHINEAMQKGSTFFEWRHWRHSDHHEFTADVLLNALTLGDNRVIQAVVRDVTQRKQFEEALREAKDIADRANNAKSEFLSSMSHELRTPMNAILGFSQLMQLEAKLSDKEQEYIKEIMKAGNHLLELINQILDLAKIESGRIDLSLEAIAIGPLLSDCLHLVAALADRRAIDIQYPEATDAVVLADYTRLKQVLINLLSNAIKYNCEGGRVTLEIKPGANQCIAIAVSDTGPGLSKDQQVHLFEPFNRLDAENSGIEGTGIGLTLSKNIIELMHGRISVASKTGVGTTFTIELPQADCAEVAQKITTEQQMVLAESKPGEDQQTVLYIEDNPANLKLVSYILRQRPHIKLLSAHTAELGIELAQAYRPELILLDINMPGMDGYQVLQILKNEPELKDTPVIAVTARAMLRDVERGMAAGFADYFTKPLDVHNFLQGIDRMLNK